ncbi:MAG: winged helix-turn-helix domain-containing protein, partial [Acidobacteria bacterium]|nr:winged helix-turn-helix domain-containing protein [Acidobacteriota bacterium]
MPGTALLRFGAVEIDPAERVVRRAGSPVALRPKVFDLLLCLIENRPRAVSKQELLRQIWPGVNVSENSLAQCVIELRRALGDDAREPKFIRNLPKVGYQFIAELAEEQPAAPSPQRFRPRVAAMVALALLTAALLARNPWTRRTGAARENPDTTSLEARHLYSKAVEQSDSYHAADAIAGLRRAVAIDPDFAMAQARIGYTYAVTWGLAAEGKPFLELAFRNRERLSPRDRLLIEAWYALANLDYPAAIRRYRKLLAAYPDDVEAYARLGRLLRGEERYEEAIAA